MKTLLEDLEEIALRLDEHLRKTEKAYPDWFIEDNEQNLRLIEKSKKELDTTTEIYKYMDYNHYQSKLMAYLYVLEKLNSPVSKIVVRKRGWKKLKDGSFTLLISPFNLKKWKFYKFIKQKLKL